MLLINDLARHNGPLDGVIRAALDRVLRRGYYIMGPENKAFESEFAAYIGVAGCVAVGNGTDALELALRALQIAPGDEVMTVANAGMYASTAIRAVGAEPLYIDIEPDQMQLDVRLLPLVAGDRTRAIIVTHLYGCMANVEAVIAFARPRGIAVIEDCAQAHGARRNGQMAGSFGDLAAFSFYPTKNLGALGDGGAVVSQDEELLARLRSLRQYGWARKYHVDMPGGRNSRLDEIQAAILLAKLPLLDTWNERRRVVALRYNQGLDRLGWQLPARPNEANVCHLYVVRPKQRELLRIALANAGVASDIHYPVPDHLQTVRPVAISLTHTEAAARRLLTLPCFPEMQDCEIDQVIHTCRSAAQEVGA